MNPNQSSQNKEIKKEPINDFVEEIMNQRDTDILKSEENMDQLLNYDALSNLGQVKEEEEEEDEDEHFFLRKTNKNDALMQEISFNALTINT